METRPPRQGSSSHVLHVAGRRCDGVVQLPQLGSASQMAGGLQYLSE